MISKDFFLDKVYTIFDETPKEQIKLDTKFKDLDEWNSLLVLGMIVTIEDNFSCLLTAIQINEAETINDLYLLVENNNAVE
jgi:acyl carrier protein